jgi:hypothetical protein
MFASHERLRGTVTKTVLDVLKTKLTRLGEVLSANADKAYRERDEEGVSDRARAYAAGEGHAYGIASDKVRSALVDEDGATGRTGGPEPPTRARG